MFLYPGGIKTSTQEVSLARTIVSTGAASGISKAAAGPSAAESVVAAVGEITELSGGVFDGLVAQGPETGHDNYSSSERVISRWIRRVAPTQDYAGAGIGINGVGPGADV